MKPVNQFSYRNQSTIKRCKDKLKEHNSYKIKIKI